MTKRPDELASDTTDEQQEEARARSAVKILIVEDQRSNLELFRNLLAREGYAVAVATDGVSALEVVEREAPDLVLLDVMMPRLDGFEVCQRLKSKPATRLTPVVLVTSLVERKERIRAINAGADDFLTKPVDPHELTARVRSLVRLKRYTDELDTAESVILSLGRIIEARDPYTQGHCQRLARYASALGTELELDDNALAALYRGGYLHDVGKVGIPDPVLLKADPLTVDEYALVKQHPLIGDHLCGELRLLRNVRPIVRHHHERFDGSGYPDGLQGDEIPLLAQIIGVVDVYDALTTDRPYKEAVSAEDAYGELVKEAARGWRRGDLVEELVGLGRRGTLDRLAAGEDLGIHPPVHPPVEEPA